ncbi:MAG: PKD domain-containing protein, partial [Gammaproteobacteria bacterium]|nr:PKD domain-containing protein [Gammaproteobacteria bacterium]
MSGGSLGIVFDERLRTGSVPPPGAFEVIVDDGAGVHPAAVEIDRRGSQREVTLSLATSVPAGSAVKVRYTRPAARDERLRDRAGNSVADFTRTVTNDSPAGQPVAAAGPDRTVDPGEAVTLDGSGSTDPDGDSLAYAWTQVSGASMTLSGADTATASFTAPESPGDLVFRLTATDPGGLSAFDEVVVRVRDAAP